MVRRHIHQHHCVGSDHRVITHHHRSQQLGSSADINMAAHDRHATRFHSPQRNLLKNQAVRAHLGLRMDDHAIGMRQDQTTTKLRVQRNVCTRHNAPEAMSQGGPGPQGIPPHATIAQSLVVADAAKKSFAGAPLAKSYLLSLPVGLYGAGQGCLLLLLMIHLEGFTRPFILGVPWRHAHSIHMKLKRVVGLCIYSHLTALALI